jgi:type II secretory pathway component PulF
MKIRLNAVSVFASSMATCLRAGMPPGKSLHLSGGSSESRALRRAVQQAMKACERGEAISDGLEASARDLPEFMIPVIRAGELSGRQLEAYQLIHAHCDRLGPSLRLVRNTWLYPLICILAGWCIRLAIVLYFGAFNMAWLLVRGLLGWGFFAGVGWGILRTPFGRLAADSAVLQLPFIREAVVRASIVLFFATFRLGYEAGGLGVLQVLDLALATVRNRVIREDLAQARPVLEESGSFEAAFAEPSFLNDAIKSSIAAGSVSGHLGTSLEQIVRAETMDLELSLEIFNRIFQRLVAYGVAMSVVGTILFCLTGSVK